MQFAALLIGLNIRTGKDAEVIHRVYEFVDAAASAWEADLAFANEDNTSMHSRLVEAEARIEALERVRRATEVINTTTHEASKGVYLGKPCAHGNLPVYPTHARWCDECWQELEDALAVLRGEEER